jgi:lysophospholipase L1-like esterase
MNKSLISTLLILLFLFSCSSDSAQSEPPAEEKEQRPQDEADDASASCGQQSCDDSCIASGYDGGACRDESCQCLGGGDDASSAIDDDSTPPVDDDSLDDDQSPLEDDDSTITDDDVTAGDDDLTAFDDDSTLPVDDDVTPPIDDDTTPVDDDSTPVDDDSTPVDDDSTPVDDDSTPSDDDSTPPVNPLGLTDVKFVATIGDSLAAGYNAEPREKMRFDALLFENDDAKYPTFAGKDIKALWPAATIKNIGNSGAKSDEIYDDVKTALGIFGSFPKEVDGDVVVFLSSGGNDFNDDVQTIISTSKTEDCAEQVNENNGNIYDKLREYYGKDGHKLVVLQFNLHDPTDGEGTIPAGFSDGFCEQLSNPLFQLVKDLGLSNLNLFNQRMAEFIAVQPDGVLADNYTLFMNHAMNGGSERWIDDDCIHPNNEGHHRMRALLWELLTGESIPAH